MQENTQSPAEIVVSAVVFRDSAGKVLTVRKKGSTLFQLPGGKPEPGETSQATAVREIREEIGVEIAEVDLQPVGVFRAAAANEAGCSVKATVFRYKATIDPHIDAEIDEFAWIDPSLPDLPLAPLLKQELFPII
ncbi:NUDIX hydrolase [Corynebacterium flavescens]